MLILCQAQDLWPISLFKLKTGTGELPSGYGHLHLFCCSVNDKVVWVVVAFHMTCEPTNDTWVDPVSTPPLDVLHQSDTSVKCFRGPPMLEGELSVIFYDVM